MDLVESHNILITTSLDCTVRLWTTEGHYIGKTNCHVMNEIHEKMLALDRQFAGLKSSYCLGKSCIFKFRKMEG